MHPLRTTVSYPPLLICSFPFPTPSLLSHQRTRLFIPALPPFIDRVTPTPQSSLHSSHHMPCHAMPCHAMIKSHTTHKVAPSFFAHFRFHAFTHLQKAAKRNFHPTPRYSKNNTRQPSFLPSQHPL